MGSVCLRSTTPATQLSGLRIVSREMTNLMVSFSSLMDKAPQWSHSDDGKNSRPSASSGRQQAQQVLVILPDVPVGFTKLFNPSAGMQDRRVVPAPKALANFGQAVEIGRASCRERV